MTWSRTNVSKLPLLAIIFFVSFGPESESFARQIQGSDTVYLLSDGYYNHREIIKMVNHEAPYPLDAQRQYHFVWYKYCIGCFERSSAYYKSLLVMEEVANKAYLELTP
ncbi:MAG: hypothetical protein WBB45_08590, partial [Cyclobacteriaceae bacterium]